jgi:hypothetical protein
LLQLLLVTILCLLLLFFLSVSIRALFGYHKLLSNILYWLLAPGLIFGYMWRIYKHLSSARTVPQRLFISFGISVTAFIILCLIYRALMMLAQSMLEDKQARFDSPADRMNQILFYEEGDPFGDEVGRLYAKPKNQKEQYVALLNDEEYFQFSYGEWTKDGQVFVCSFLIFDGVSNNDNPPVKAVAYDFSANKIIVPIWFDHNHEESRLAFNWKEFESNIEKLIAAHGGLSDQRIDDDIIEKNEKGMWPWQIPK